MIFLEKQYAFRAGTVGTVADRTAYGFVGGYERDYNKFYRDAGRSFSHGGCGC